MLNPTPAGNIASTERPDHQPDLSPFTEVRKGVTTQHKLWRWLKAKKKGKERRQEEGGDEEVCTPTRTYGITYSCSRKFVKVTGKKLNYVTSKKFFGYKKTKNICRQRSKDCRNPRISDVIGV